MLVSDESGPSYATGVQPSPDKLKVGLTGHRLHESELCGLSDGAAGWVHVAGDVDFAVGSDTSVRVNKRLLMTSGGEALDKSRTIKAFLMAMYDILEALRYGIIKKHVMYRDISPRNILVNIFSIPTEALVEPTFIKTILDNSGQRHPPTALLCDLDNSGIFEGETDYRSIGLLKSRTGTHMFIARAVEAGRHLGGHLFSPMPELSNKAIAERYVGYYQGEAMRTFRDEEGKCHGGRPNELRQREAYFSDETTKALFYHQPRHDVESMGWCIIAFCLRSQPEDRQGVKDSTEELKRVWLLLSGPERGIVLRMTRQDWERALHPSLKFLSVFLVKLCMQMGPEYGFLEPPPAEAHLHEAFQRLLLNQISEMEKDVDLDTMTFREVIPELQRAEHRKMDVPFGPSTGQSSDSPSESERRPTKRSVSIQDEPTIKPWRGRKRAKKSGGTSREDAEEDRGFD